MAGIKALVGLALLASCGITCLILACALPQFNNWWPTFVLIFYVLAPLPLLIASRLRDPYAGESSLGWELALFFTAGLIISAYGLPLVLTLTPLSAPVISPGACGLVMGGNTIIFITYLGFTYVFKRSDEY